MDECCEGCRMVPPNPNDIDNASDYGIDGYRRLCHVCIDDLLDDGED